MTDDLRAQLEQAMSAQHGCDTLLSTSGKPCNRCCQSAKTLLPVIADLYEAVAAAQEVSSVNWTEAVAEADNDTDRGYATGRAHAAEQAALRIRQVAR